MSGANLHVNNIKEYWFEVLQNLCGRKFLIDTTSLY